jgi:hypothetical protein
VAAGQNVETGFSSVKRLILALKPRARDMDDGNSSAEDLIAWLGTTLRPFLPTSVHEHTMSPKIEFNDR